MANSLTNKQLRVINCCLDRLFNIKSLLVPQSAKDYAGIHVWERLLSLSENRTILLTDTGICYFNKIVDTIHKANIFNGQTDYSDVWSAFHHILEDQLSRGVRPENASELLSIIQNQLSTKIANYTYAVPIFGLKMDGIDSIKLGSMQIIRSPIAYIDSLGVKHDHADLTQTIELTKNYLWLIGYATGTRRVSQKRFRELAEFSVGMLAVAAASMHERGASGLRIGIVMSPEEGHGNATWLS